MRPQRIHFLDSNCWRMFNLGAIFIHQNLAHTHTHHTKCSKWINPWISFDMNAEHWIQKIHRIKSLRVDFSFSPLKLIPSRSRWTKVDEKKKQNNNKNATTFIDVRATMLINWCNNVAYSSRYLFPLIINDQICESKLEAFFQESGKYNHLFHQTSEMIEHERIVLG